MKIKPLQLFFIFLWLGITGVVLYLSTLANQVYMYKPYALIVDEISDLQLIQNIYAIHDIKSFLNIIFINNPEPYHGFISYLIPAALSYIPFKVGGEPYLILSFKMCSALFIIASYFLISISFFKKQIHQLIFYCILLLLPFTNMFLLWPRCESYQYFFLALFFFFIQKRNWETRWPFFLLGLSLASRISVAPYIAIILIYFHFFHPGLKEKSIKHTLRSTALVFCGLLTGQTHLLYLPNFFQWFYKKYSQIFNDTGMDVNYSFSTWLKEAVPLYSGHSFIFFSIILTTLLLPICYYFFMQKHYKKLQLQTQHLFNITVLLGLSGALCFIAIMYKIKIVYSFWYLQQHYIFILLGLLAPLSYVPTKRIQQLTTTFFTLLFSISIAFGFEKSPYFADHGWDFSSVIHRDEDPYNINNEANYQAVMKKINSAYRFLKRPIYVRVLADLWQPRTTKNYIIESQWFPSPFIHFDTMGNNKNDVVIVNKEFFYPPEKILKGAQTGEKKIRTKGYKLYKQFVCIEDYGESTDNDCYKSLPINDQYLLFYRKHLNLEKM